MLLLLLLALAVPAAALQPPPRPAGQPPPRPPAAIVEPGELRVFLDCQWECDFDYLRREITFVDHVRDPQSADIHVLVTTEPTGGGGMRWNLQFIGLGRFKAMTKRSPSSPPRPTRPTSAAGRWPAGCAWAWPPTRPWCTAAPTST
jgi:hypothetical protein